MTIDIHDYAVAQGGVVLSVWKCLRGPLYGGNVVMNQQATAASLELPLSTVQTVYSETFNAIQAAWQASPHYVTWIE